MNCSESCNKMPCIYQRVLHNQVDHAIECMFILIQGLGDQQMLNRLLLISANYVRVMDEYQKGLMTFQESDAIRNRCIKQLIVLMDEIKGTR